MKVRYISAVSNQNMFKINITGYCTINVRVLGKMLYPAKFMDGIFVKQGALVKFESNL
ncbi:hypothetical protein [Pedobacter alpinus]|uniref:Uncharacterized protein n=1 Tax=Pedobacter alpinus TaxID=1590643 RepID=A0ABW5TTE1_9SPHI